MIKLPDSLKPYPWKQIIQQQVAFALEEDLQGTSVKNDITAQLIPEQQQVSASLLLRQQALICGIDWFNATFHKIDPEIIINWKVNDGEWAEKETVIATLSGSARGMLTAERTAMNFLQTLSATATSTWKLASLIKHTPCKLLDTRKTLPGLRMAQKYAVICGGGENHRIGLHDRFLIKENHIFACGGIEKAIHAAKALQQSQNFQAKIEIEVENLSELEHALIANADIIMLDNFTAKAIKQALTLRKNLGKTTISLEASGNINANTIVDYAETGVDYVSVGAITKSIEAIDLSFRVEN